MPVILIGIILTACCAYGAVTLLESSPKLAFVLAVCAGLNGAATGVLLL